MKKQIGLFTAILFAVSTLMVSCSPEVHEHTFAEEWKTDENFHWKECTGCKEKLESAEHEYEWTITKEATCTEEGSKTGVCEVCKKEVTEKIDAKGHSFGDWITTKAATEEETGSKERVCDVCKYKDTEVIEKLEHEHTFAEEWSSDETNHWHASTCGHEVTEGKTAHTFGDWTITKEPTEEAEGSREKSCTVCEYTVPEVIAKLEHTHKFASEWTSDETNHWKECRCGEKIENAEHEYEWTVTKEATCTEEGSKTGTCKVCKKEVSEKIDAKGHSFGIWTTTKEATCTEEGSKTGVCEVCKKEVTEKIDAKEHSFGIWTTTKEATCTEEGSKTGVCEVCKKEVTEKIDVKGHSFGIWTTTKEPTETEVGQMQSVCEVCKETVTKELQPVPEGFSFVEAGTFKMGSNEGWDASKPVHEVTITKPFYMGKYEVTQAEYEKYCSYGSSSASLSYGDGDNYPAYRISWYEAIVYCNKRSMAEGLAPCYSISDSSDPEDWGDVPTSSNSTWNAVECNWNANGYRLPTEAEWEYAARAGDNTVDSFTYSGTSDVDELGDYAWYKDNSNNTTHEVGTKLPNAFGLYDMSGNVWEWCWNWFTDSYDTTTEGGSDPTGPSAGSVRVNRGGSWNYNSDSCAVSDRDYCIPFYLRRNLGFRVLRASSN